MSYHVAGVVSSVFYLLSISGLWIQIRKIFGRKTDAESSPTAVISLELFFIAFLCFFAFLAYGVSLPRFNHYLVWPRMVACILVIIILREIALDRKTNVSFGAYYGAVACLTGALLIIPFREVVGNISTAVMQYVILGLSVLLARGYYDQVMSIRREKATGAVSGWMHFLTLLKDISTIAFGFAMSLTTGWPIIVMCSVSAVTKVIILWHFQWVKRQVPLADAQT